MKNVLVLLVAAACLFAAPAPAHVFDAQTSLTIRHSPAGGRPPESRVVISGRLVSHRPVCRAGKVVRLFLSRRGADRLLARDTTDSKGDYRFVRRPPRAQRVYVVVARSLTSSYGHSHRCGASRSATTSIPIAT